MRTAGDIEDIIMELSRKSGATAGLLGMVGIGRFSSLGPIGAEFPPQAASSLDYTLRGFTSAIGCQHPVSFEGNAENPV
jgi:hypothetical protein